MGNGPKSNMHKAKKRKHTKTLLKVDGIIYH